jgi:hypothetical protein
VNTRNHRANEADIGLADQACDGIENAAAGHKHIEGSIAAGGGNSAGA